MSWEDRSVTLGNVKKEEFDLELAMVTVTENRVIVDFKERDDWKRITREVGEDVILREVWWEDVESVDVTQDHLYYPHIDISVAPEEDAEETDVLNEKRIYFIEDEAREFRRVLNTIRRFWNAWRQRNAPAENTYHYQPDDEDAGEEVDLEEAIDGGEQEDIEAAAAEKIGGQEPSSAAETTESAAPEGPEEPAAEPSGAPESGEAAADQEPTEPETGAAKEKLQQVPDDGDTGAGEDEDGEEDSGDASVETKKQDVKDEVEDIVDGFLEE